MIAVVNENENENSLYYFHNLQLVCNQGNHSVAN